MTSTLKVITNIFRELEMDPGSLRKTHDNVVSLTMHSECKARHLGISRRVCQKSEDNMLRLATA